MGRSDDCSGHARVRMQQRGVSDATLDLLLRYGRTARAGSGCQVVFMDGQARRRAIRDCGRAAGPAIDRVRSVYAVLGEDGVVVTVGHRLRRLPRD